MLLFSEVSCTYHRYIPIHFYKTSRTFKRSSILCFSQYSQLLVNSRAKTILVQADLNHIITEIGSKFRWQCLLEGVWCHCHEPRARSQPRDPARAQRRRAFSFYKKLTHSSVIAPSNCETSEFSKVASYFSKKWCFGCDVIELIR